MKQENGLTPLLDFLDKLGSVSIFYTLTNPTDRAIMVTVVVPGERWEVEFFEDRDVRVEVFAKSGDIAGPEKLIDLFDRFSE